MHGKANREFRDAVSGGTEIYPVNFEVSDARVFQPKLT